MGFFDKLKDKAQKAFENDDQHDEINKVEENEEESGGTVEFDYDSAKEEDDENDHNDYTQRPKGWENLSDEDVFGRISVVALEYNNRGEDVNYLIEEGFINEKHLYKFKEYFEMHVAEERGISLMDLVGVVATATQNYMLKQAQTKTSAGGVMEPVEGITCEDWAKVNAKIASGGSVEESIKIIGCDLAKWDRVNNEWLTRMSNDTSFSISQVYAQAFNTSATGNLGTTSQINEQNFPYEKYVEIFVAVEKLNAQGRDAQEILSTFGMTVVDWSNASSFWMMKANQNSEFYYYEEQRLRKIFEEKYKAGSVHNDIEF